MFKIKLKEQKTEKKYHNAKFRVKDADSLIYNIRFHKISHTKENLYKVYSDEDLYKAGTGDSRGTWKEEDLTRKFIEGHYELITG